ncbi:PRC and DUF2382 domain-containing protein [Corynebacterium casei]|uniref:PRC and DUF2382 domain-containing protein n=1 Tax=Corynebacterium casei TaxID=160386 RepID=UPI002649E0C9|nr:PRC and DUF2382 domain-containing protein [Corynebacterium casei]MDN5707465.1 PRC and DUF2382 domain-containing protein [Corynebacterium casei]
MSKNVQDLLSATAYDNNGDKLGDVNEVFVDDDSGQPTFVDVNHGLFGMGNSLVPLRGHSIDGNNLTLAFPKDRIKDAPDFDTDKPLTPDQQTEIYDHYGISGASHVEGYTGGERPGTTTDTDTYSHGDAGATDTDAGAGVAGAGAAGAGVAGAGVAGAAANNPDFSSDNERPHPDFSDNVREYDAGASSTHTTDIPGNTAAETAAVGSTEVTENAGTTDTSEVASTQSGVPAGETRLRKYVVTETQTVEVPVTHEEIRVEQVPNSEEADLQANTGGVDADGVEGLNQK